MNNTNMGASLSKLSLLMQIEEKLRSIQSKNFLAICIGIGLQGPLQELINNLIDFHTDNPPHVERVIGTDTWSLIQQYKQIK